MGTPFLVCAIVTAISALTSLGFSLAALSGTAGQTRTLAYYTCARSLALTVVSLVTFVNGSGDWLQAAATAMIILQTCDAVIGITVKDTVKTFGPAGTAIANLAALVWFLSQH